MGIRQDFIVVDNICGDLDFEDGGNPVVMNRVLTGRDPVLMDAYVCNLMHYEISDVPYVELAGRLGVGCSELEKLISGRVKRIQENSFRNHVRL